MAIPRLFVIGDSISMHYGPHLEEMVAGVLAYGRKTEASEAALRLGRPQGAGGGDSSMVLEYLTALEKTGSFRADIMLLNCGLHDLRTNPATGAKQVPLEAYRRNLREVIGAARRLAGRVAWVRTTPVDERRHNSRGCDYNRFMADVEAYNAAADAVMREFSAPTADLYTFTCNLGPDVYTDGVHFTEPVRRQQAAFLAGWLFRAAGEGRPG